MEQYSVQDPSMQGSYGGVSEYYQGGQEYESNQMYYDQQSQHQYNLNQDTQSRDAGAIPPITNYDAGQHSVSYYNPNMGQGDSRTGSYYGTEGVTRTDDPLGRTKGSPIVTFGFGGKMILMFPQVVTRFSTSSSTPVTKVYPGELKFHNLGNTIGEKKANSFPGPLLFDSEKSSVKARKKAVTEFLDGRIAELSANSSVNAPTDNDGQNEVILWKLLKVLCDHDGLLLGSPEVEKETLEVVFPASMHKRNEGSAGISSNAPQHKSASPGALDSLQELLLKGDRSVATKFAMDNRLWAHALIIGSCVGKETWQQVVQKFTQEELTSSNDSNRESMTVMYNLFAGLGKDAIKDFVPESINATQPSMFVPAVLPEPLTPKATSQLSQNSVSIEKLTKWRETIAMILANRTPGDTLALTSFGDLLRSQGWIYAAHICYLLSPQSSVHSGLDTPSVKTVLFGVDHSKYHACFARDLNALDRTEIYEHAISLRSSSPINGLPFLQPYKLQRAWYLADCGYTSEALRYCESIANIVKVHPKGSPYFHELFLEKLKELHERLTKSLGDKATSSNVSTLSWLTAMKKPTLGSLMDAVDRGLNRFIVGDSDAPKPKPEVTREITADPFSTYNPRVSVLQAPNVDVPVRSASVNDITSRYEHQRQFNHFGDTTHAHGRRSASPSSPSSAINQYEGIPMAVGRSYTTPFIPTNVRGEAESKITEGYESPYDPPKSSNGLVNEQHTDQSQAQSVNTWENTGYGYGYGYEQNNEYNAQSQPNDSSYPEQSNSNAYQYGWSQNPTSEQDNSYGYQATSANDVNDYSNNQEGQFVSLMSNSAPLVPTFGSTDTKPYTNQYASSTQPINDVDDDDLGFGNTSLGGRKQPDTTKSNDDSHEGQKEEETSKPETTEKSENKEQPENRSSWSLFSFLGRKKESGKPAPAKAHLPSGNNFYFDEAQNRWVNKAASAEESKPAALPPPPPSGLNRTQSASPTVGAFSGGPPSARSSPGPSMLAPPGPGIGMPRSHSSASGTAPTRRGVRNRYVDVMNPN
ncbi:hypothetical protein K7432_014656 [Basidiobolus ranarum]|uniref:Protein transport protein sec16 n=1 Tax=Basidiobolus ranarum TaxID=34480 RepID=A0ABR2VQ02_9FUNG